MCEEDRDWFNNLLKECIQEFNCSFYEVVPCQPVLYGDFMNPGADTKVYTVIEDREKVSGIFQNVLFPVALWLVNWTLIKRCFV